MLSPVPGVHPLEGCASNGIRIAAHQIESASIKLDYPGHYQDSYIKVNKIQFDAHRPRQVANMFLFDAHQG